jgi:hypothetical protein
LKELSKIPQPRGHLVKNRGETTNAIKVRRKLLTELGKLLLSH